MNGATRVRTTHRSEYWHVNNVFERENTRVVMAERNNALFQYATNLEKKVTSVTRKIFSQFFFCFKSKDDDMLANGSQILSYRMSRKL